MDGKKIKERLKSARDFIKNKQFAEALEASKEILASDATNYNALVFQGAAFAGLQKPAEALASYREATLADSSQILAWQGISSVYEKQQDDFVGSNRSELINCYEKLFASAGADKSFEIGSKLCDVCLSQKQYEKALNTAEKLMTLDSWDAATETAKFSVWKAISVALPLSSRSTDLNLLETSCKAVIGSSVADPKDKSTCWEQLIQISVQKSADVDEIWKMCLESSQILDEPVFQLELMCQLYLDTLSTKSEPFDVSSAVEALLRFKPESGWLKLIKGQKCLCQKEFVAAESELREGLKLLDSSVSGHLLIVQCLVELRRYQEAATFVKSAFDLLSKKSKYFGDKEKTEDLLKFYQVKVLLGQTAKDGHMEALKLCEQLCEVRPEETEYKLLLSHVLLKLGMVDRAKAVNEELSLIPVTDEILVLQGLQLLLEDKREDAAIRFTKATEMNSGSSLGHFYLGQIALLRLQSDAIADEEKDELQTKCLQHLLQAAKLNPFFSDTFVCLGDFYRQILGDLSKAKRCYQKAFELNAANQDAGAGLIDCLLSLDEQESAVKILKTLTDSSRGESPKWAWMRLGLHQMKFGDPTDAIRSFQEAIKKDPKDPHCWECLGDAFVSRGSYCSAIKVFTKVTELSPDDFYSYYQIAALKLKLGLFAEAVDQYKCILGRSPDYIPALQGISEAYLQLARQELGRLLHGRAIGHCQEALVCLTRTAKMRPEISCLWKQLGDACTILHVIPSQQLSVAVPSELLSENSTADGETQTLSKKELLSLGARCYGMALRLRPEMSSLWHDLGVNFFCQSKAVEKVMSKSVAMKSLQALRKAVALDPSNHEQWTALGVVAASKEIADPGLAQHCFIKSIEAESNNVTAWTNLGTLYLINDQIKLAHEAFKVAQSLEPSYQKSWIGQAFIAETFDDREAMDLFRHTTELADSTESCIAYSHWVCQTLMDPAKMSSKWYLYAVEHLNAVTAAGDAMSKYTDCITDSVVAWNMYGILLERQNLCRPAFCAVERALQLLKTSGVDNSDHVSQAVRLNYARLLCKNGKHEEAVEVYRTLNAEKSFDVACGLGLCLMKAGQFEECLQVYEKALNLSSDKRDQSLIHVALGMTAFMMKDVNSAKTHFFQSLKESPSLIEGLKALLSLAFLQRDPNLLLAVLQTTQKAIPANSRPSDIVLLTSTIHLLQRNVKEAKRELIRNVHLHPDQSQYWTQLTKFIILTQPDGQELAEQCGRVALAGDTNNRLEALLCLGLASLSRASAGNRETFRAAQKAVHLRPDAISSWSLLLHASHLENIVQILANKPNNELMSFASGTAERIFSQIESELRCGRMHKAGLLSLRRWCARQYALSLLTANQLEPALKFLEQAAWYYDDDPIICGLMSYFSRDGSLKKIVKEKPSANLYQILLAWLLNSGSSSDAQNCYKMWLQESRSSSTSSLTDSVRSAVARCLLEVHLKNGSEKDLQDLIAIAKKANDRDVLEYYEKRKSSS